MPGVRDHPRNLLRFAGFELDPLSGELRHGESSCRLQPQPLKLLLALLQRPGELVTREELKQVLMPNDAYGDFDHAINVAVSKLRAALNDPSDNPKLIDTLPRRGYRFIGDLEQEPSEPDGQVAREAPPPWVSPRAAWSLAALALSVAALLVFYLFWPLLAYFFPKKVTALTDKDTIVLADFTNSTGDPVFTETLRQALAVQLSQSPFLNILSDVQVRRTLSQMGRQPQDPVADEVARETCVRNGSKVYIAGSIARLGTQFVLSLKAVNCASGDVVVQEQTPVPRKEEVLDRLGDQASVVRRKLGESLSSIKRFDVPIVKATTSSLEALQAYSLSIRPWNQMGVQAAIPYLKRAIELDPNFALAYARLAVAYYNLSYVDEAEEYAKKAYSLRERTTDYEKYYIEGLYYNRVTGQYEKALQVYELFKSLYPQSMVPYNNSGVLYLRLGQCEKSLSEYRESARRARNKEAAVYVNLAQAYLYLGRVGEARRTLADAEARQIAASSTLVLRYELAFLQNDKPEMQRAIAQGNDPEPRHEMLYEQSLSEAYYGRLTSAREFMQRAAAWARRNDLQGTAAYYLASIAIIEADFGDAAAAHRAASESLTDSKISGGRMASLALGRAGYISRAQAVADDLAKRYPSSTLLNVYWLPTIRASIALSRNDPSQAVEILRLTSSYELGSDGTLEPIYMRGLAYLRLHRGSEAAAEFQKILDHPGIMRNHPRAVLAHLGLARALVLQGDTSGARAEYRRFLTFWKDADPDIPILQHAKAEYAKLQ